MLSPLLQSATKDCALKYATIISLQILNQFRVSTGFHFIRRHIAYVGETVTLNVLKLGWSNVHFILMCCLCYFEKCKMCDISWSHNLLVYPFIQNKKSELCESWRVGSEIKGFPPPPLHSGFAFYQFINQTLKQLRTHGPSCFSCFKQTWRAVSCIVC